MPPNFSRRSQRKRQTRLAFEPVESAPSITMSPARRHNETPSSQEKPFDFTSPARKLDDAENVPFLSGKKYAVVVETPEKRKVDGKIPFKPLTTPAASSQSRTESNDQGTSTVLSNSDSDPGVIPTFPRRRATQSKRLSPPHRSLPVSPQYSEMANTYPGTRKIISGNSQLHLPAHGRAGDDSSAGSSPEEDEQASRSIVRKSTPKVKKATLRSVTISDGDTETESPLESPIRVSMQNEQALFPRISSSRSPEQSTIRDTRSLISGGSLNFSRKWKKTPGKQSPRQSTGARKSRTKVPGGKESVVTLNDDEDEIAILPTPRQTRSSATRNNRSAVHFDLEDLDRQTGRPQGQSRQNKNINVHEDGNDRLPTSSRIRAKLIQNPRVRLQVEDTDGEEEDIVIRSSRAKEPRKLAAGEREEVDTDNDDEDPISSPIKRRRNFINDDSGSDPFTSPTKRFRPETGIKEAGKHQSKRTLIQRQTRQGQRKKPHRTAREKKLELLKRQRAGEKIVELTPSSSDDGEPRYGLYDSDSDLEVLSEFEDEEKAEDEGIEVVRRSLRRSSHNDDDADFVVADDDEPLGVPGLGLHDIPLEFTHQAHKPLKEHFKDAIEWMVQNKINPAFNRNDPIYVQAFRKLDVEVSGYATSVFSSSVWKEPFQRALWARPVFIESEIASAEISDRKCDACGRANHPAKFEIQFGGKAYYKETLDEVDNEHDDDEEEEEDDSSSTTSVDSKGRSIPGEDVTWYVGRANAQTAHSLIHWKHALNEWVIDRLKSDGHLTATKLTEREGWNTKKRGKYANRTVDEWEAHDEIKNLYRDFKINLDTARQGKLARWAK